MADKTTKTIRIKWVRSGIGFPRRQKGWVRSLGLRELNQVVERPDTAQIRGLVARAHHLVEIVEEPSDSRSAPGPEFTVVAPAVAPAEAAAKAKETARKAAVEAEPAPRVAAKSPSVEEKEEAVAERAASGHAKSKKASVGAAATKKAKPAKEVAAKAKKAPKETAHKGTKPHKAGKK